VDAFAGFTGKLELRSGLEGDRRFPTLEGDHVVAFEARRPTELVGEPTQYGLDASWSEVARRASRPAIDGNLLVFGADPPLGARLRPGSKILDQCVATAYRSFQLGRRLHEIGHGFPYSGPLAVARGQGAWPR
jgi:hypothetical protein